MDYLTDLDVNEHWDLHIDQSHDLATSSGVENLYQSVALDTRAITQDFIGEAFTPEELGLLEERVFDSLDSDPQVGQVRNVSVTTVDQGTGEVTMDVILVENESFELTLDT